MVTFLFLKYPGILTLFCSNNSNKLNIKENIAHPREAVVLTIMTSKTNIKEVPMTRMSINTSMRVKAPSTMVPPPTN